MFTVCFSGHTTSMKHSELKIPRHKTFFFISQVQSFKTVHLTSLKAIIIAFFLSVNGNAAKELYIKRKAQSLESKF